MLVGPKRSGKGTIARILKRLIGEANVATPSLWGLSTNFGLQTLIGKPLAIIADARLTGRTDQGIITERLLTISGEDGIDIDRKHKDPLAGVKLNTRLMLLTNELPRLTDSSGALASRFVILPMKNSFYGQEDHRLFERLADELPGILNWSIEGWKRLQKLDGFILPDSAKELIETMENLSSPIQSFVRECCNVGQDYQVQADTLYEVWPLWCKTQGLQKMSSKELFGKDLRSLLPEMKKGRQRVEGLRATFYFGIQLQDDNFLRVEEMTTRLRNRLENEDIVARHGDPRGLCP